jgi:GST-like protein
MSSTFALNPNLLNGKGEYVLYGTKGSGSACIEAALTLAAARFRKVDAASWQVGPGLDELKVVNPLAQIPTLLAPDGELYTESAAVLMALAARHPHARLLPPKLSTQLQALRALTFIAANCYALIGVIDYPERYCDNTAEGQDDALRERIRARSTLRLYELWALFAQMFAAGKSPFLFGETIGAVDLLAYTVSRWSGARHHIREHAPALHAVFEEVRNHAKLKAVWDSHFLPH